MFNKIISESERKYLNSISSVELMNEWTSKYNKKFTCYLDFLEWVQNKDIRN